MKISNSIQTLIYIQGKQNKNNMFNSFHSRVLFLQSYDSEILTLATLEYFHLKYEFLNREIVSDNRICFGISFQITAPE